MTDERKRARPRKHKTVHNGREEAVGFMLHAVFAALMKQDLDMDEDEVRALRRALIALIWLVQENLTGKPSSGIVFDLIEYLLLKFPPLADRFDATHRHFLARGEDVMRAKLSDEKVGLLIREEFCGRLLAEGIEFVKNAPDEEHFEANS